jgi:hypothetical protein
VSGYFVVRVWLPDLPGALGHVAGAIGSLSGDVVGIDIMERGNGIAVDDLVVKLPDSGDEMQEQLRAKIGSVEGVEVEWIRATDGARASRELDALEIAGELVQSDDIASTLVHRLLGELSADWAVLLMSGDDSFVASAGDPPAPGWLTGFLEGARHLGGDDPAPPSVAWARLRSSGAAVMLGRQFAPFRWRERREIEGLAVIADTLLK